MAKKTTVCRRNFAELLAAGVGGGESISSSPSRAWRKVPAACFVRHKLRRALLHVQLPSFDRANSNKKKSTKNTKRCELVASFFLFGKPCRRRHRVGSRWPLLVGELEQCSLNLSGILKAQTPASILRHEKLPKLPELAAPDRRCGQ